MGISQDDRVLPLTRLTAGIVILVLLLAFFALYIFPDHTDTDFAWTILPRTSAILIGAGYTAGAYFFARLLVDGKWHRVQAGFLPITAFTICMLAATLLHWSRFHLGALNFYLWTIIYALTPFLVPFVWWLNRATEMSGLEEHDLRFSPFIRRGLGILAGLGLLAFVVVFIQPSILIALAPWKLTELTARIFSGWSILTMTSILSIAVDGRWSATRTLLESALVGIILTMLGLPRMWSDFDTAKPMTYIFVAGLSLALVAFIGIHFWAGRAARRGSH